MKLEARLAASAVLGISILTAILFLDEWLTRLHCNDFKLRSLKQLMRKVDSDVRSADYGSEPNLVCGPGVDCYHADYFSARIALAEDSLEEAESFLSKEIDLSYPFPQLYLGLLYFEQGLRREAEEVWIRIPSISRYLTQLANKLYYSEHLGAEARILGELAVKSEPENRAAHYFLGTILLHNASQPEDLRLSIEHSQRSVVGTIRDF